MFAYYEDGITQKKPSGSCSVEKVVEIIKGNSLAAEIAAIRSDPDKKLQNELKAALPYVTFSGTFKERLAAGLIQHSGLICLDFDDLADLPNVRLGLVNCPICLVVFTSPRGSGLKAIIKTQATGSDDHKKIFRALAAHFLHSYGLTVDKSGSDVSRACYLSHDPDIYYNPDAQEFIATIAQDAPVGAKKSPAAASWLDQYQAVDMGDYYNCVCPECGKEAYIYKNSYLLRCKHANTCGHERNVLDDRLEITFLELETDKENEKIIQSIFNLMVNLSEMKRAKCFDRLKQITGIGVKAIRKDCENYTKAEVSKFFRVGSKQMANPEGWRLSEQGLFDADGQQISHYPFYVDQTGRDSSTGVEYVRAVFRKEGKDTPRIVPKRQIAITREMERLADQGFPVNTANMLHQVRFLAGWCAINHDLFETFVAVSQLGWHGDLFIFPDRIIGETNENIHYVDNAIDKTAYLKGGTLDGWCEAMRMLSGFPDAYIARFLLYAAFASIALEPLEKRPFIVHLQGDTSTGKTSSLRIPASVYGKPVESKTIIKWRSTDNYLIRYMEKLKNIPVIIDELSSENKNPKDGIVYQIESGMSKGKAVRDDPNGTAALRIFRLAVFSSGESSLLRECAQGGAQARVIEFSDRAFGGYVPAAEYKRFQKLIMENYGHAADVFIVAFKRYQKQIDVDFPNDKLTAIEQRVLEIIYLIRECGLIANDIFRLGFDVKSDIDKVWTYMQPRLVEKTDSGEKVMALVRDFYSSHAQHISVCAPVGELKRYSSTPIKSGVLVGFRLGNDIGFIKTELKKYLDEEYKDNIRSESSINLIIKNKLAAEKRPIIDNHAIRLIMFANFFVEVF